LVRLAHGLHCLPPDHARQSTQNYSEDYNCCYIAHFIMSALQGASPFQAEPTSYT